MFFQKKGNRLHRNNKNFSYKNTLYKHSEMINTNVVKKIPGSFKWELHHRYSNGSLKKIAGDKNNLYFRPPRSMHMKGPNDILEKCLQISSRRYSEEWMYTWNNNNTYFSIREYLCTSMLILIKFILIFWVGSRKVFGGSKKIIGISFFSNIL